MKKVVSVLAVLALMVGTTQAAEITWGPVFDIDPVNGVEDLAGGGSILWALNFGEDPAGADAIVDVTNSRETISFEAYQNPGGNASGTFYTGDGGTSGDVNFDNVLDSHSWKSGGVGTVIQFSLFGLTAGQMYQVQFIAAADTRGCCGTRTQTLDDGMGNVTGAMARNGVGSVVGTFTAGSDTKIIYNNGDQDPGGSALILREIPEPSVIAMLVAGLVGLAWARRRR